MKDTLDVVKVVRSPARRVFLFLTGCASSRRLTYMATDGWS